MGINGIGLNGDSRAYKPIIQEAADLLAKLGLSEQLQILHTITAMVGNGGDRVCLHRACSLVQREPDVLLLLSHGYCRKEIGLSLSISANTAARHIANIYGKLGVRTVAEATRFVMMSGLNNFDHLLTSVDL